jgi:hypothetical protein
VPVLGAREGHRAGAELGAHVEGDLDMAHVESGLDPTEQHDPAGSPGNARASRHSATALVDTQRLRQMRLSCS